MPDAIQVLKSRLEEINQASQQIIDSADAEQRDFSDGEQSNLDNLAADFDKLNTEIALRERIRGQQAYANGSEGRRSDSEAPDRNNRGNGHAAGNGNGSNVRQSTAGRVLAGRGGVDQGKSGFGSLGEFLVSVRLAALPGAPADPRLQRDRAARQDLATTYSNETSGADGGFAVPPDFRTEIISTILGEDSLLGRTDQIVTASNLVTMPVDNDEVWNDTTGIFARWENEGGQKPESKVALDQMSIRLNKLVALVPVTDELLEDAPSIEGFIRRKAPAKINFKVSRGIIAGSGTGQPLGILNSPATITVDAGLAPSASIQFPHIAEMWGRMYGPFRQRAVWLVNPELEWHLMTMFFSTAAVATVPNTPIPVYLPGNTIAGQPFATLLGRPVIPTQACEGFGARGDIIFADLTQYLTLIKAGAIRTDVSIHVYFVQDITAFRFVLRIGGMPWLSAPYQPRSGSFTQSAFVTLEAR